MTNKKQTIIEIKIGGIIGISLVSAVLLLKSFSIIPSGYVGLKSTIGVYKNNTLDTGLHFKIPLIQKIKKIDIKSRVAHYGAESTDNSDSKGGVINLPAITVLDQKNLKIGLQATIRYKVNEASVYEVYVKQGGNFFTKRINPTILEEVRNVLGKYKADEVSTKREEISKVIKVALDKAFAAETLFTIEQVNIRAFILDDIIMKRIKAVEEANQREKALIYEVKQEEQQKLKAIIKAEAQASVITTKANAEAEATLIRAKSQAKANTLLSQSLTNNLVRYKEIEKWNGQMPSTVLGSSSSVILNKK